MTDQRAEAIALAAEVGPNEAARRLGVNPATLRSWIFRASSGAERAVAGFRRARRPSSPPSPALGVPVAVEHAPAVVVDAVPVRRRSWPERAAEERHELAEVQDEALLATHEALVDRHARDAQHFATTYGILTDKAQLLGGGPTQRIESDSRTLVVHLSEEELATKAAAVAAARAKLRAELEAGR